ncbi:MAG: ABC transporter ATP-binding protein [Canibacter sp.]
MISLENINRSFGDRHVLKNVSFDIADGRMTGFVGGNGAGKTTTMRILLGVLSSDSGTITMNGEKITRVDRAEIGYMPEERGLYPKMKVRDQLQYLGELHGLTADDARTNTTDLLDRLEVGERAGDKLEDLSLGNQQRVQIAAALVHKPKALVLDEPFSGLDPMAVETVLAVLRDVAQAGAPVLFSSHQLDIVDDLCDDIVVIADGEIRAAGDKEEVRKQHSKLQYEMRVSHDAGWVREIDGTEVTLLEGGLVRFHETVTGRSQEVLRQAVIQDEVQSFAPVRPRLSQIFKEVVR